MGTLKNVRKKLDVAKLEIIMIKSEIKTAKKELSTQDLSEIEAVGKLKKILALKKSLGERKAFVKEIQKEYKSL